jgi:hypothetical protein
MGQGISHDNGDDDEQWLQLAATGCSSLFSRDDKLWEASLDTDAASADVSKA